MPGWFSITIPDLLQCAKYLVWQPRDLSGTAKNWGAVESIFSTAPDPARVTSWSGFNTRVELTSRKVNHPGDRYRGATVGKQVGNNLSLDPISRSGFNGYH